MTIQYFDEITFGHNDRKYKQCPCCTRYFRSNWKLIRHKEEKHGIEVKRY